MGYEGTTVKLPGFYRGLDLLDAGTDKASPGARCARAEITAAFQSIGGVEVVERDLGGEHAPFMYGWCIKRPGTMGINFAVVANCLPRTEDIPSILAEAQSRLAESYPHTELPA